MNFAKRLIQRVLAVFGIQIKRIHFSLEEDRVLSEFLHSHTFDLAIDVGANTGQYAMLLRKCGYAGEILSFEPLSDAHSKLTQRAAADARWTVAPRMALGSIEGSGSINVAGNSASSSILSMGSLHLEAAPHSANIGSEAVKIVTLDAFVQASSKSFKNALLKIDTQGFELEVLRGAKSVLQSSVAAVQVELSLANLYEGQPKLFQIMSFLSELDFELVRIIPGFADPRTGRLLQFDGVFSKHH